MKAEFRLSSIQNGGRVFELETLGDRSLYGSGGTEAGDDDDLVPVITYAGMDRLDSNPELLEILLGQVRKRWGVFIVETRALNFSHLAISRDRLTIIELNQLSQGEMHEFFNRLSLLRDAVTELFEQAILIKGAGSLRALRIIAEQAIGHKL